MKLGENITDVHKANRCLVLKILNKVDKISRVDLSRQTGLNKATITNIINEFTQLGIVQSSGAVQASNGRRTAGISLHMHDIATIVIRINRQRLSFGICNVHGELIHLKKVVYDHEDGIQDILDKLFFHTEEMLALSRGKKVLGISIAILGWLYRRRDSYIAMTDGFPELSKADIKKEMENHFPGYFVILDHDANMSALAEWKEYTKNSGITSGGSMLNIACGIGLGGGIIIDGKLFHGKCGVAGEVGHMGINFNSEIYAANSTNYTGMYEEYASPRAMHRDVMNRLMDFPDTPLNENSTIHDVYEQYENDDLLATWAVNRMAKMLAYGLVGLLYVLNPDVIVLGDEIIHSDRFLKRLRSILQGYLPAPLYEALDIRISSFNSDSVLIGAGIAMTNYYLDTHKMIDFLNRHFVTSLGVSSSTGADINY